MASAKHHLSVGHKNIPPDLKLQILTCFRVRCSRADNEGLNIANCRLPIVDCQRGAEAKSFASKVDFGGNEFRV
jgi:hypothetical protein